MQNTAYCWGTGRRKCALARVRVRPGDGTIKVNERTVEDYFPRVAWQLNALQPLKSAGLEGKIDVFVRASGGGLTGQAGAVRLGIARALLKLNPELRPVLKKNGLLTRPPRMWNGKSSARSARDSAILQALIGQPQQCFLGQAFGLSLFSSALLTDRSVWSIVLHTERSGGIYVAEEGREARKAILRAAREGFAARGFYGTSMEYITRNAGVSKGAVYWYFPGKWEVYKAVVAEEAERLKGIVLPPGLELPPGEAMDFFLTRGERLIDIFAEDPVCRLLFVHLQLEAMRGREEMIELVTTLRASITEDAISVIEAVFPGNILTRRGISHRELVNMFVGILNGIILNIELTITREEARRNWRFLIRSVLGGIGNEP